MAIFPLRNGQKGEYVAKFPAVPVDKGEYVAKFPKIYPQGEGWLSFRWEVLVWGLVSSLGEEFLFAGFCD